VTVQSIFQKEEKELFGRWKCSPLPSVKGYALYEIDVKNTLQQLNSTWDPCATNVLSELLLLLVGDMQLVFSSYAFSKHVYTSIFMPVYGALCFCIFFIDSCSHLTGHLWFLNFHLVLFCFVGQWVKSNSRKSWAGLKLRAWKSHGVWVSIS